MTHVLESEKMRDSRSSGRKWYAARLVFASHVGNAVETDPLCEERVVLFFASDLESARKAAVQYGERESNAYRNEAGDPVEWRFVRIEDFEELTPQPVDDGWEVASRHFRPSDLAREKEAEERASRK